MTNIDFNEPSTGNVSSDEAALTIKNSGTGILCESTNLKNYPGTQASAGVLGESQYASGVLGITGAGWVPNTPHTNPVDFAAVAGISNTPESSDPTPLKPYGYCVFGIIKGVRGALLLLYRHSGPTDGIVTALPLPLPRKSASRLQQQRM